MKAQERILILNKVRINSWRILYFQNLLIVLATLLFLPQFILLFLSWQIAYIFGGIINLIFTFAILLDLIAILLLCISSGVSSYYSEKKQSAWSRIAIFFGLLWVGLSLLWRSPLYNNGPYDIGFTIRRIAGSEFSEFIDSYFVNNVTSMFLFLIANLVFLAFLYSNDMLTFSKNTELRIDLAKINLGSFYGLTNLIGCLLLLLFLSSSETIVTNVNPSGSLWLAQLGMIIKLIVTPILGMHASKKYLASLIHKEGQEATTFTSLNQILPWIKSIWQIQGKTRLFVGKKTWSLVGGVLLVLMLFPLSPISIEELTPQPIIYGPYINRTYQNADALLALQAIESISIDEVTGCNLEFYMDNETLAYFLDLLSRGSSIEGAGFKPYHYRFSWNMSIEETQFSVLNYSTVQLEWFDWGQICFTLWENTTRYHIPDVYDIDDLNETDFISYASPVKWVIYGSFKYSETFGELGGHYIDVKQLVYLSADLEILCVGVSQMHAVA